MQKELPWEELLVVCGGGSDGGGYLNEDTNTLYICLFLQ